jgi:hypothetical protein
MKPPFDVRYVLVSDYATIDHTGKLIIAGLYTEDIVVPVAPLFLSSLVITILAKPPASKVNFQLSLLAPNDSIIAGGGGELEPVESLKGSNARAILGFQFNQIVLPEGGNYRIVVAETASPNKQVQIHDFNVVINPEGHAKATDRFRVA